LCEKALASRQGFSFVAAVVAAAPLSFARPAYDPDLRRTSHLCTVEKSAGYMEKIAKARWHIGGSRLGGPPIWRNAQI
jgi:hypothetical protein